MAEDVEPQRRTGSFSGRRRLAAVVGAAAAVLAVGVPVALAGRASSGPPGAEGILPSPPAGKSILPSPPGADGILPSRPAGESTLRAGEADGLPPPPPAVEPTGVPAGKPVPGQVKGRPVDDGCPVTAPLLLDALRAGDRYQHLATTGGLGDVDCYDSYALARTRPDGADVVFRYSQLTETWHPIAGACAEVPADIRAHLRRCA
ncbi:hypothetical protein ACQP2Y_28525 [Actinoplanes sp. CA-051413]|uniref:hypothetical protein n=1 Tax=Actinoplanes sp. CA-051413 TaxID=3239899 RepID=UPI003D969F44